MSFMKIATIVGAARNSSRWHGQSCHRPHNAAVEGRQEAGDRGEFRGQRSEIEGWQQPTGPPVPWVAPRCMGSIGPADAHAASGRGLGQDRTVEVESASCSARSGTEAVSLIVWILL